MLIDLHVHSNHTRGCTVAVRDLVRRAREVGLDGIVLTDLNTLEGLAEVREAAKAEGFLALCGVEVATDHGHYLCYFPDPARVPAPAQIFGSATPWLVRDVLAKVRELGGVAVAAHPYDKTIERPSGDAIFTLYGLAAIEGLNASRRPSINDLAIEAADHMNLPCTGASGAHDLAAIGKAATLFRDPVASEADLVPQLKAGKIFSVAIGVTAGAAEREPSYGRRERDGGGGDRRHDRGGHAGHGGQGRCGERQGGGGRLGGGGRDRR